MKTSLIMEGGAMRGMFTCGVTDIFLEENVNFDAAAGISAGVAFGCNYKSRQIGRAIRYNKKYCNDPRFCSVQSWIKTGDLFGADFCYRELPEKLDPFDTETFRNNPLDFYCSAIDVKTGEARYHHFTDGGRKDIAWMQASASMPMVSRPVHVDGYDLLDGGVIEAVPYDYMCSLGYDRNIVILTQPKGYRKKKSKGAMLMKGMLHKYPKVYEAMKIRHENYNRQMEKLDRLEEQGAILVIRPEESLGISRTERNPEELERVYQLGRAEAKRRLEEVRTFLEAE